MICSRFAPDDIFYEKQKNFVRATIKISGYWICPCSSLPKNDPMYEPAGSSSKPSCKVTLIVHTDLGGYLPAIMNLLTTNQPQQMMTLIRSLAKKEDEQQQQQS